MMLAIVGVFGAALAAVGSLSKWGIETLRSGRNPNPPSGNPKNGKNFTGQDALLLQQTHEMVFNTDRRLERVHILLDTRLGNLEELAKQQIAVTRGVGESIAKVGAVRIREEDLREENRRE
jgi:hypothetical protein